MIREYEEGELVDFSLNDECGTFGTGIIRGIASNSAPVIGKTYIVQVLSVCPSFGSTYPYSCLGIFEIFLKPHVKE